MKSAPDLTKICKLKKSRVAADNRTVASPDDRIPTAWLFTRGESSVHMEAIERANGVRLVVSGPGSALASHDFPDHEAMLAFTRERERALLADGFQLHAVAERRTGGGRRAGGAERRRSGLVGG